MATAPYQYLSDDGTTYQVVLPSDFASALNYVPATGSEPYVPAYISMRYSTFVDAALGLFISVYVTQPFTALNPPQLINVGLQTYQLRSSYGEVRGLTTSPNVIVISGVQGPPGEGVTSLNGLAGSLSLISSDSSVTISPSGSDIDLQAAGGGSTISVSSVGAECCDPLSTTGAVMILQIPVVAGSYLCFVNQGVTNTQLTGSAFNQIAIGLDSVGPGALNFSAKATPAGLQDIMSAFANVVAAGPDFIDVFAFSGTAGQNLNSYGSGLMVVQYA